METSIAQETREPDEMREDLWVLCPTRVCTLNCTLDSDAMMKPLGSLPNENLYPKLYPRI